MFPKDFMHLQAVGVGGGEETASEDDGQVLDIQASEFLRVFVEEILLQPPYN